MNGPDILLKNIDVLRTSMGGCFVGERAVFRGHDIHADLKDMDWMELYMFGITGRRFTKDQTRLMNAIWTYTSYPDSRIWNLRIAALAGTARSTGNIGISASLAVSEAAIYGRGIDIRAIDFLKRTKIALDNGIYLADCVQEELKTHRSIAGYGRPIAAADERIAPTMALASDLQLNNGPHVKLAYEVEDFLLKGRWRMHMNIGALYAALAADLGLSTHEYYLFMFPAFLAGTFPCYLDAADKPEGTLLPLSCTHICYEGKEKRNWPKA